MILGTSTGEVVRVDDPWRLPGPEETMVERTELSGEASIATAVPNLVASRSMVCRRTVADDER